MSAIPRALENPSLDGGFWQIRTFPATWLNGIFWSNLSPASYGACTVVGLLVCYLHR